MYRDRRRLERLHGLSFRPMSRLLFVAPRFPPDVRSGWSQAFARLVRQASSHAAVHLVAGYQGHRGDVPSGALGVDLRRTSRLTR